MWNFPWAPACRIEGFPRKVVLILLLVRISPGLTTHQSHHHHHHHHHQYHRGLSQSEDSERDLAFRALLCPGIPPVLLPIYRFHLITRRCYEVGIRGPCGSNMLFVKQPFTRAVGKCICRHSSVMSIHSHSRPLIHHPDTNNCYYVYTQAYCAPAEWLLLDIDDRPVCQSNTCLELRTLTENEVESREFIPLNGTCVELGLVSELCTLGQVVSFMNGRPACTNLSLTDNEVI